MSMRFSIVMLSEVRFENVHENMLYMKLAVVTKKRLGWGTYYFPTNLPSQNTEFLRSHLFCPSQYAVFFGRSACAGILRFAALSVQNSVRFFKMVPKMGFFVRS